MSGHTGCNVSIYTDRHSVFMGKSRQLMAAMKYSDYCAVKAHLGLPLSPLQATNSKSSHIICATFIIYRNTRIQGKKKKKKTPCTCESI